MKKSIQQEKSFECLSPNVRWLTITQTAEILQVSVAKLRLHAQQRRFHPAAARKIGGSWRFKRDVIVDGGALYKSDVRPVGRKEVQHME